MVNMPHIRFGDATNGYEFPTSDGFAGQVLYTDGNGQLGWMDATSVTNRENGRLLRIIEELNTKISQLEGKVIELEQRLNR